MGRTDRLFNLVELFRGGRLWRGQDLAERLGVSVRTLYRDIGALIAAGIPIEGARGVGFQLREPLFLPPMTLGTEELEALHLGLVWVARSGDADLAEAATRLHAKIEAVLPGDRQGRDYAKDIAFYAPMPQGVHRHMPLLRQAIRAQQVLSLTYTRLDETQTRRIVWPLHLEFWGQAWTMTAWCTLRQDFRAFRVDRITYALRTGDRFTSRPGRRYSDYLAQMVHEAATEKSPI